jgi:arylsulfatase A-like enzyme
MNAQSFGKHIEILLLLGATASLLSLLLTFGLFLLSRLPFLRRFDQVLRYVSLAVPAFLLGTMGLLLIDNFTYTLFKIGIVNSEGFLRAGFGVLSVVLVGFAYYSLARSMRHHKLGDKIRSRRSGLVLVSVILTLAVGVALPMLLDRRPIRQSTDGNRTGSGVGTNVILITCDGLDADHMSVYGYERETTPTIKALAETSLVAENAFTNSGVTSGSIVSILTGKYPIKVNLLYPPDILKGDDSYEHLPGILRSLGYYSAQFSYPTYVDAYTLNLLQGFDQANGRTATSVYQQKLDRLLPYEHAYVVYELSNRLIDRLLHIFFFRKMYDPYKLITAEPDWHDDQLKLESIVDLIRTSDQPIFIHNHYLGTHGPTFAPRRQVFSEGHTTAGQGEYNLDFYDDSILQFDGYVAEIIQALKDSGKYDNTILIIGSDHGLKFETRKRLPLIIHFPNDQHARRITTNVQSLDIAPTVLDYLGIEVPAWMDGTSLLVGNPVLEPIFAFTGTGDSRISSEPPYYQFEAMTIIYCDRWYFENLSTREKYGGVISGSTAACPPDGAPTNDQILEWMADYMEQYGYDVSSLR